MSSVVRLHLMACVHIEAAVLIGSSDIYIGVYSGTHYFYFILLLFFFCSKTKFVVLVRTASPRRF